MRASNGETHTDTSNTWTRTNKQLRQRKKDETFNHGFWAICFHSGPVRMALCVAGSVDHITNDTYTSPSVFVFHLPRSHTFSYFSCLFVRRRRTVVVGQREFEFVFLCSDEFHVFFFRSVAALFCRSIRFWFVSLAVSCVPYALRPFLRHFAIPCITPRWECDGVQWKMSVQKMRAKILRSQPNSETENMKRI